MQPFKVVPYSKFSHDLFVHVNPVQFSNLKDVGDKVTFLEYPTDKLITRGKIVHKELFTYDTFTDAIAYMDKEVNLELYKEILRDKFDRFNVVEFYAFYIENLLLNNLQKHSILKEKFKPFPVEKIPNTL